MKIKIDAADQWFSKYVRLRDGICLRCFSPVEFNSAGDPISHQCSHYIGRRKEATRFDPQNASTLCYGCHQYWHENPREYDEWMISKHGKQAVLELIVRSNSYKKKDRTMEALIWEQAYKDLKNECSL